MMAARNGPKRAPRMRAATSSNATSWRVHQRRTTEIARPASPGQRPPRRALSAVGAAEFDEIEDLLDQFADGLGVR